MIREGRNLARIHKNIVVKCPLTRDRIMACPALSKEGIRVNVTLCFSATQALIAAKAGAYFISPFVGRLDDISSSGMDAALAGEDIGAMPFKVMDQLFSYPLTDKGLEQFLQDWGKVFKETPVAG
jgi:transaldolase